jgi:nickel-dependent lactate racemase
MSNAFIYMMMFMVKVKVHYGKRELEVSLPKRNLFSVVDLNDVSGAPDENREIKRAIQNPIGHAGIQALAQKGDKTLIIVDDFTRATPAYKILPVIIKELNKAGISDRNIKIMLAGGTHRRMKHEEVVQKIGEQIVERFEILKHDIETVKNKDELVHLGKTPLGTPISVNKHVVEAEIKIGVGQIVGHPLAGWGGGAKIIQPGVCGHETTWVTHWLATKYKGEELLGVADNPIRLEMEEVAKKVGLDFIVNVIQNSRGEIVGVVAGDPVKAHRKGVEIAKKVYGVKVPSKADIVLTDAYPHDIDMWQAVKGIYAAELVVKKGGTIVLCAPCPEGVSREHPALLEIGYTPADRVEELIRQGKVDDLVGVSDCARVGELLKDVKIVLCSEISKNDTLKLNLNYAETPQKAVKEALVRHGSDAKILILRSAGDMVPIVSK